MAQYAVTASTDLTAGKGKRLASYQFGDNTAGTAWRVLLRDGGASGTVLHDIRGASLTSKEMAFKVPVIFALGLYVDVASGTVRGSVDLI
jgi:hypothetical protein